MNTLRCVLIREDKVNDGSALKSTGEQVQLVMKVSMLLSAI